MYYVVYGSVILLLNVIYPVLSLTPTQILGKELLKSLT